MTDYAHWNKGSTLATGFPNFTTLGSFLDYAREKFPETETSSASRYRLVVRVRNNKFWLRAEYK